MDVQGVIADIQHALLEARALAILAEQLYIGQELHLDRNGPITLTSFATPAGDIEREMASRVASPVGFLSGSEKLADDVEGFDISDRIRSRRATDWALVHQHDL